MGFKLFGEVAVEGGGTITNSGLTGTGSVTLPRDYSDNTVVIIPASGINVESQVNYRRYELQTINTRNPAKIAGEGAALLNFLDNQIEAVKISNISTSFSGSANVYPLSTQDGNFPSDTKNSSIILAINEIFQEPVDRKNITSISYENNIATITTADNHGYAYTTSGITYPVDLYTTIEGITFSGVGINLNDRFEIYSVNSANTFAVLFNNLNPVASGVIPPNSLINAKVVKGSYEYSANNLKLYEKPKEGATFYSTFYKFLNGSDDARYSYKVKNILFDGVSKEFNLYKLDGTNLITEPDENLLIFIDGVLQIYGESYIIDRSVNPNKLVFTEVHEKERNFFAYTFSKYKVLNDISPLFNDTTKSFDLVFLTDNIKLPDVHQLLVLLDGVPQNEGDTYTINDNILIFNEAPVEGKKCRLLYFYGKTFDKTISIWNGKIFERLQDIGTTTPDGNGLSLATIITANPAVIPNTFQDARFFEAGKVAFLTRSFGTSLVADNTVSSSGYYNFYGMQAGVTSGSSTSYIFKTTSNISRLWLPITAIQTSMSATPASITGGTFVSSSLTIAPSRSYSGVPYLTTGTSTWTYLGTGSGMFDPAFLNGVVFRQSISETLPGTVLIAGSSNSDVSCNTSGIATSGKVYDAVGNVKNSGLPRINDQVRSNVVITHSISSGDSNIADTGFSTGTTFTATTLGFTYTGSTGANLNTSTFPYHQAGTYGQPAASGSLGIYGGGTSNSTLAEYFTSESYRRVISNSTTLTTQWNEATALTLGNHGDLQVKPSTTNGYLVNPESSKGYWYPTGGYNASDYKWYMRQFTYSGATGTVTITLNPNNISSLTTFDATTSNSYAIGLIFEYQVNNRGGGNVVLFDVRKGNAAYNSGTQTTGQFNPFSDSIEVQGNFTAASTTGGVITLTLNGGVRQVIDTPGALNVWMVVRCIGTPSNTLRQITLS